MSVTRATPHREYTGLHVLFYEISHAKKINSAQSTTCDKAMRHHPMPIAVVVRHACGEVGESKKSLRDGIFCGAK